MVKFLASVVGLPSFGFTFRAIGGNEDLKSDESKTIALGNWLVVTATPHHRGGTISYVTEKADDQLPIAIFIDEDGEVYVKTVAGNKRPYDPPNDAQWLRGVFFTPCSEEPAFVEKEAEIY